MIPVSAELLENVAKDSQDDAMVSAIISIAKNLQFNIVAEGIDQVDISTNKGCDLFQGIYYSKPLFSENCTKLLREERCYTMGLTIETPI